MTHFHERDRVHAQPASAPPPGRFPAARPRPGATAARIDCDSCPVAGHGCAGCMVALLGPVRLRLDAAEQAAVDLLVDAGVVDAAEARSAYAEPHLPEWLVQARSAGEDGRMDRSRPSGARSA
ncbi:hypothetical protein GA707_16305 [Nostocoides sp. F2B08]|uniref:hypothetical protein n=1 Tax=Nostocoides sp. F2B08 TaxID=2653936 RepID=UPI0012634546|nr:hypothetical protein [Tetrasphaera sp. F2B08]KAB7742461.1 hypothetical protein GA707_16305 [Tetrasphaera sp. F2B08]